MGNRIAGLSIVDFKNKPNTSFKDIDELSKKETEREVRALREGINEDELADMLDRLSRPDNE